MYSCRPTLYTDLLIANNTDLIIRPIELLIQSNTEYSLISGGFRVSKRGGLGKALTTLYILASDKIRLGGLGERRKLPQWGLERSPNSKKFRLLHYEIVN